MCFAFFKKKVKKLDIWDISLVKLSVFAGTLLLVKYFPVLTTYDWYWYAALLVLAVARPFYRMYLK